MVLDKNYYCGACEMEVGVDKEQNCFVCGDWLGVEE